MRHPDTIDTAALGTFIKAVGAPLWRARMSALRRSAATPTRLARHLLQYHCIELALDRLHARTAKRAPSAAERWMAAYAADAAALLDTLSPAGRDRFVGMLRAALDGNACLIPAFHLLRTASMQRARGFAVGFAGLDDGAPFDLLIRRDGAEAEVACDVISAEAGRDAHRAAWLHLMDLADPELQAWLRAHPGRYLLKLTLPQGLALPQALDSGMLAALHRRIIAMLSDNRRTDADEAAVLRLDPLLLPAAQSDEVSLMPRLRREFGPEAHLSVTVAGGGIVAMAARAGRENEVAAAVRRRMATVAPARLTGTRPGILAMFLEDTDKTEWRLLRDRLDLEGEARQFLTNKEARSVVAVTCTTRLELFGLPEPDAAPDGELRFRNQAHPAAKTLALAPAVLSSL